MRTAFAYTCARIIMFGASVMVLYWAGARGILLLGLALLISALLSYVLLNKQRQIIAGKLNGRLSRVGAKAGELKQRLDEGARAEDAEDDETSSIRSTPSHRTRKSPSRATPRLNWRTPAKPVTPAPPIRAGHASQPPRLSCLSTAATASCRETRDVSITTSASSGSS